jgi:hypothetical protein
MTQMNLPHEEIAGRVVFRALDTDQVAATY